MAINLNLGLVASFFHLGSLECWLRIHLVIFRLNFFFDSKNPTLPTNETRGLPCPYLSPPCLQLAGLYQSLLLLVDPQLDVKLSKDPGLLNPLTPPTNSPPETTELLSSSSRLALKFLTGEALKRPFTSLLKSWPRLRGFLGFSVNCCLQNSWSSASLISSMFLLVKMISPPALSSSSFRCESNFYILNSYFQTFNLSTFLTNLASRLSSR